MKNIYGTGILSLLFLNAAGSWASWLVMGPYLAGASNSLIMFGLFAFFRQIFSFAGSLFAESINLGANTSRVNTAIEIILSIVNFIAILIFILNPTLDSMAWVLVWGAVRYFIGGFSTVSVYRLILTRFSPSKSIVAQLGVMQGSVVAGALIALGLSSLNISSAIITALIFDIVTSLTLAIYLKNIDAMDEHYEPQAIKNRLKGAISGLYKFGKPSQFFAFTTSLIGLSGLPTIFLFLSSLQQNTLKIYSSLNMLNGFLILLVSFILGSFEKVKNLKTFIFIGGGIFTIVSSALLIFSDYKEGFGIIVGICGLSLGSTSFLLSSHQLALVKIDAQHASAVRSSMALYLTLIFGLSEIVSAYLLTNDYWFGLISFRTVMIVFSIILFSLDYWKENIEV